MTTRVYMKKGDRLPPLEATLQDSNGNPIDLTGGTVKFLMRQEGSSTTKVDAAATIVDATAGTVRYDWAAADVDTAGTFNAEFEATVGGLKQTFPGKGYLKVEFAEDLG